MPKLVDTTGRTWTYGCEHELADWDTRKGFGKFGRDPEPNIMNSNGIAGDPTLKDYPFGAELNSPPTDKPEDQGQLLAEFMKKFPAAVTSHRVGMHVHIRVPGLAQSLVHLKTVQRGICNEPGVFKLIDPVPYKDLEDFTDIDEYKAHRHWVQYIRRSHWTTIPEGRVAKQLKAGSVAEFFAEEAPKDRNGNPLFHAQPRAAVNIRQLLQSDTLEFRSFFQPLDPQHVVTAVEWCRDYLLTIFNRGSVEALYKSRYNTKVFPPLVHYVHWMQKRWEATAHSKCKRPEIRSSIREILAGRFDDVSNAGLEYLNETTGGW